MSREQGNRLCHSVGHDWAQDTIVENYRRCVREDCKTVEQLVNGEWIDVTVQQRSRQQPTATQPSLFAPDRAYPSKDEVRRAEQAYRFMLGR